jgi:cardiolipin synthase A/B
MSKRPPQSQLLRRWSDRMGRLSPEGGGAALTRSSEKLAARLAPGRPRELRPALQPEGLIPGNGLRLLVDGEAFEAMLEAIGQARERIDLETYIWADDRTGRRFTAALTERAKASVQVRCLIDGGGSFGTPDSLFGPLRAAGGRVAVFHPVGPWRRRWGWTVRDHRKLLLIDDRLAFTGGINLGDEYAPRTPEWGGKGWHDLHLRIEGPAASDFARLFEDAWRYVTGDKARTPPPPLEPAEKWVPGPSGAPQPPSLPPLPGGGLALALRGPSALVPGSSAALAPGAPRLSGLVQPLAVGRRLGRKFIQRHYQHAVSMARRRVYVFCAYFIPNRSWRRVLRRAASRGVDVRVLVPRTNDIPAVHFASRYTYQALLDSGVRIFEYLPSMMHAKALVVDGVWAAVGSYNLDQRSLMYNWEITAAVVDPEVCAALEARFASDLEQCREIDPVRWPKRGLRHKLRERFWHFFRLLL